MSGRSAFRVSAVLVVVLLGWQVHRATGLLAANWTLRNAEDFGVVVGARGGLPPVAADRVVADLERAFRRDPADARLPHAVGSFYLLSGRPGAAIAWYRSSLRLEPRVETMLSLARALNATGARVEAKQLEERAARLMLREPKRRRTGGQVDRSNREVGAGSS